MSIRAYDLEGNENEISKTFSICFSSPLVKFSISCALCNKTVPFVSVCAISNPDVNTATFAFVTRLIDPSGSRLKTIPRTTLLPARLPPIILTTRTLSTLKFFGFGGMTIRAASATNEARISSEPYCFDAMAGFRAEVKPACVKGVGREVVDNAKAEVRNAQSKLYYNRTHFRVLPGPSSLPIHILLSPHLDVSPLPANSLQLSAVHPRE